MDDGGWKGGRGTGGRKKQLCLLCVVVVLIGHAKPNPPSHPPAHLPIPTCLSRCRWIKKTGGRAGGQAAAVPHPAEKKKQKKEKKQTDPLTASLAANEFNRMLDLPSATGGGRTST